ncbi:glucan 4-alpha-glucosidase [Ophiostoma piceae UAMH 11346]|uniref:Glucan 4-alpha-glucosidase n=1 Tax=Ophiostoma piceae (strain UAMH 11346) TaxID=1262450 RepID=S3BU02_OPHP1|nr:glucan 4-alpha-glucosidase [Ophiostoma piceae UAMH 11346]
MDHSDEKSTGFERRTSRRLSRQLSVHTSTDLSDSTNNDAYLAAMGISVSDGFRPSVDAAPTPSEATNTEHHHTTSIPTQKTSEVGRRQSSSGKSFDSHVSATAGTALETSSIAPSTSTLPSSFNSSEPSPSELSASSFSQSPLQPSSVPVSVPETAEQEVSSASTSTPSQPPPPPPTFQQPANIPRGRPSSIAKPPIGSLSLGGVATSTSAASGSRGNGGNSNHRAANVRESTASSVAPTPQQDEPYQGPSGPSFPYQMYPQNVGVTRTLSSVTTSTATQSESSYTGPRGPAFPYGMYPQNTMTETAAGPSTVPTSAIPVGFPGMADNYQRRIGPDGEDIADMIGPDGHTEQLPPYTRYPDEAYSRKIAAANGAQQPDPLTGAPMLAASSIPDASMFPNTVPIAVEGMAPVPLAPTPESASAQAPASSPIHESESAHAATAPAVPAPALITSPAAVAPAAESIPGAGGIGLAPRNPEYDGAEEAGSPRSRYSLRSFNSDGTGPEINTAARGISEKRKPPNFIQRYGGRRILGIIPYWAICLVLTAILLMCIILGAVVGTFVARHKRAQANRGNNPQSITVTVDATPIPTPSNLPGLPTGTFSLPLQKDEGPGACFNDTTQAQAWSCNIPFQYGMIMTINSLSPTPDGPMYNLSINCNMSATVANNVYFYGEQAPVITTPMPMQLVNDTLDPNRGPAWFKMMPYNKTVVVHETWLSAPAAAATDSPSNKKRYHDNVAPASIVWGDGGNPFHRKGVIPAQAGDKPWVCTWPDTILEVFIYPNQNTSMYKISLSSAYTPSSAMPTLASGSAANAGEVVSGAAVAPTAGITAIKATSTPFPGPTQFPNMPPLPPPFPRVVKVEERRMAKSPQATCVQYELKDEGFGLKGAPLLDVNGNIVEITIAEVESGPPLFSQSKRDVFGSEVYESDGEVFDKRDSFGLSKCGCLWMVT